MKQELIQKQKLPEGWKWGVLEEFGDVIMGLSPKGGTYNREKKGLPLLNGATNIKNGKIIPFQYTTNPTRTVIKGDLLLCIRATIGNAIFSDTEYCIGRGIAGIRITSKALNKYYLKYYLETRVEHLKNSANGGIIKGIKKEDITLMRILIPPLPIQQQIVAKLDAQMAQIEIMKKEVEKEKEASEEIFQSVIKNIYGQYSERKQLKSLCLKTETRNPKNEPDKMFTYIDISSVDNKRKIIVVSKQILGKDAPTRARKVVFYKDIILSTTRPNLNAVSIVTQQFNNQLVSTGFCILRCSEDLDHEFLFYYTQSADFVNKLSNLVKGALYPAVTDKQVLSQEIPFVNIKQQIETTKSIKEAFNLSQKINNEICFELLAIAQLPASILNEVFGKYEVPEGVEIDE